MRGNALTNFIKVFQKLINLGRYACVVERVSRNKCREGTEILQTKANE